MAPLNHQAGVGQVHVRPAGIHSENLGTQSNYTLARPVLSITLGSTLIHRDCGLGITELEVQITSFDVQWQFPQDARGSLEMGKDLPIESKCLGMAVLLFERACLVLQSCDVHESAPNGLWFTTNRDPLLETYNALTQEQEPIVAGFRNADTRLNSSTGRSPPRLPGAVTIAARGNSEIGPDVHSQNNDYDSDAVFLKLGGHHEEVPHCPRYLGSWDAHNGRLRWPTHPGSISMER